MDTNLDRSLVDEVVDSVELGVMLLDVGREVAHAAKPLAPRNTGAGAESLHAELHRGAPTGAFASGYQPEDDLPTVYVSWDQAHFYMYFAEVGTEKQRATPFLRPALEQVRI